MPHINGRNIETGTAARILICSEKRRCLDCAQRNPATNGPGGRFCDARGILTTQAEVDKVAAEYREEKEENRGSIRPQYTGYSTW